LGAGLSETAPVTPHVTILLSTFNGARFLRAQLQSFVDQTVKDWTLYWRDDGSSDDTLAIMAAFAAGDGAGRCVQSPTSGPHMGASPSFLALLAEVTGTVAFADQDDVWLTTKLERALAAIAPAGAKPALYCARQLLVNENLQTLSLSTAHLGAPGFPAALTQNIANGNTLVMNEAAVRLVAASPRPEGTVHDWWSYIVVSACGGTIIYDPEPAVLYRLHKGNLIGVVRPLPARALAAIRRGPDIFVTMMRRHSDALAADPARLTPQARRDLVVIRRGLGGNVLLRMLALRCAGFRRRTWFENILFRYWFLSAAGPARRQPKPALRYEGLATADAGEGQSP
jgi:glycosyltransferase involved in cell wall biosynthesis